MTLEVGKTPESGDAICIPLLENKFTHQQGRRQIPDIHGILTSNKSRLVNEGEVMGQSMTITSRNISSLASLAADPGQCVADRADVIVSSRPSSSSELRFHSSTATSEELAGTSLPTDVKDNYDNPSTAGVHDERVAGGGKRRAWKRCVLCLRLTPPLCYYLYGGCHIARWAISIWPREALKGRSAADSKSPSGSLNATPTIMPDPRQSSTLSCEPTDCDLGMIWEWEDGRERGGPLKTCSPKRTPLCCN